MLSAHWNKDDQMIHLLYDPQKTSTKAIAKASHDTYMADKDLYDKRQLVAFIDKGIICIYLL